ncbi:hypothetical protein D3C87_1830440 [compost metagenome]
MLPSSATMISQLVHRAASRLRSMGSSTRRFSLSFRQGMTQVTQVSYGTLAAGAGHTDLKGNDLVSTCCARGSDRNWICIRL